MNPIAQVMARIQLYPAEEGEAMRPIRSGFGCPLKIEGVEDSYHDCRIWFEQPSEIKSGESGVVEMAFLCPELFADKISVGRKFLMWERSVFGEGVIIEILKTPAGR